MFWSQFILAKQGPLGTIWIAAHSVNASKLRKSQIAETDLAESCDTIIHQTFNHQKVPLALRLSGQLLLGVVRIYTRKLDFLQRDSAEALVKIRQAFQPATGVDLPPDALTAPLASITQPELDFDTLDVFADAGPSHRAQLEPLATRGAIDLADPFMGDFATYAGEDEFEYGVLPDEDMDIEPEQFRAVSPGQALGGRRSSGQAGAQAQQLLDEALPMPMPLDDDDFAPLPMDDDMEMALPGRGGASLAGASLDLDGPVQLPGDSPGPAPAQQPGGTTPGAAAPAAGAGTQEGGGAARLGAAGGDDRSRKRKFKLDTVVVQTNAQIRVALADVSDLVKRRGRAGGFGAGPSSAAAAGDAMDDVDAMLQAPVAVARGACAKLRRLFTAPTTQVLLSNAAAAAQAALAAAQRKQQRADDLAANTAGGPSNGSQARQAGATNEPEPARFPDDDDFGAPPPPVGGFDDDVFAPADQMLQQHHSEGGTGDDAAVLRGAQRQGSTRRLSSALDTGDEDVAADAGEPNMAGAADGAGAAGDGAGPSAAVHGHWSKRTRSVLSFLQRSFTALAAANEGATPAADEPPSTPSGWPAGGSSVPVLQLDPLLSGQSKTHAARLFFELLVLSKDGFVALKQDAPYGAVHIAPAAGLTAAA